MGKMSGPIQGQVGLFSCKDSQSNPGECLNGIRTVDLTC